MARPRKEIFVILPQLEHLDENKTVYVSKHNIIRSSCSSNEISHYETLKVSNVVQSVALLLNDLSLEQNEELKMYDEAKAKLEIYVSNYPDDAAAVKELEFLNTQAPEAE